MKIIYSKSGSLIGSTLMIIVVITGLVGFVLAAYLSLLCSQNSATMRSQAWNAAIPVIEAGVEDALTHINTHGATNLYCDNWSQSGGLYWMQRWLGSNYYIVTISNYVTGATNNAPVIDSRGYVSAPILVASSEGPLLADAGVSSSSAPAFLGRGVRATTGANALFSKGLVAKGTINLNGNNIATDSFDSSDPAYNTNGRYDSTKNKDHGDIATDSGLTNSVNVGNANVMGHVSTGPNGSVSIGVNGTVGDKAWVNGGNSGAKPGYVTDDMNVDFPPVPTPTGNWLAPVGGGGWTYLLTSGSWQLNSLSMSGQSKMRVVTNSTAILYVVGNLSLAGQTFIQLDPGASLKLYVGGSASIGGQGIINNNANAANFYYYGLPSNTSLTLSGNAAFTGVIYAPSADFSMGGGGNNTYDFVGASITKTVSMNGHYNFHYDEALGKYGPSRGFVVTSWNEMTPQQVSTLPQGVGQH